VRAGVAAFVLVGVLLFSVFAFYYVRYQRLVDARMRGQVFRTSAQIYRRARVLQPGDKLSPAEVALALRRAGYSDQASKDSKSRIGTFRLHGNELSIEPGPE